MCRVVCVCVCVCMVFFAVTFNLVIGSEPTFSKSVSVVGAQFRVVPKEETD